MRTLSDTLTAAQKARSGRVICKLVMTSGATIKGYTNNDRLKKLIHTEQPHSYHLIALLDNHDNHFTDLDLKGYSAVISWGYHTGVTRSAWVANTVYAANAVVIPTTANGYQYICTTAGTSHATTEPTWPTSIGATVTDGTVTWTMDGYSGDEYSKAAPLEVIDMQLISAPGQLYAYLTMFSVVDRLGAEPASENYTPAADNTDTTKGIIVGTAAGVAYGFPVYAGVTLSWDSEDALIDVLVPADGYRVVRNGNTRLERINWCLGWTKEVMRLENDGKIHFLNPTVSGTTYAYQYDLATNHPFLAKTYQKPIVRPNYIVVVDPGNTLTGGATDASSSLIMYWKIYTFPATNATQADAIAAAILQRCQLDSQGGTVTLPLMNVGQEIWDYVKVTDSREGGSARTGNIQYIQRTWNADTGKFTMTFRFGGTGNILSGNAVSSAKDILDQTRGVSYDDLMNVGNTLLDLINKILAYLEGLDGITTSKTIVFAVEGALTVVANASYEIPLPEHLVCDSVYINTKVAPDGADIIVDVNLDGTTIFTTQASRPVIADGATAGGTATPDVIYLPKNGILSVDIDQIGSVTEGSDLIVEVRCFKVVS